MDKLIWTLVFIIGISWLIGIYQGIVIKKLKKQIHEIKFPYKKV